MLLRRNWNEHVRLEMWKEKDTWLSMVTPRLCAFTKDEIWLLFREITRAWCEGVTWDDQQFSFTWIKFQRSCCPWWDIFQTCWDLSRSRIVWWREGKDELSVIYIAVVWTLMWGYITKGLSIEGEQKKTKYWALWHTIGEAAWSRCGSPSMPPGMTDFPGRKQTIVMLCHKFPRFMRMDKKVLWLTVKHC